MENRLNHARLVSSLEKLGTIGIREDGKRSATATSRHAICFADGSKTPDWS